jgi:HEAT repeat protein
MPEGETTATRWAEETMKQKLHPGRFSVYLWQLLLLTAAGLGGGLLSGCTGAFEDLRDNWSDYWHKPDPMRVVTTTESGDRKAKFMAYLKEPAQHGGSQQEQDRVVEFLVKEATTDPAPACRLQAIQTLGRFHDPRAGEALETAYYKATIFAPDHNALIKQSALVALGQTASPAGRKLLLDVARAAAPDPDRREDQMNRDERLAAIRGLQHYKDAEVTATLVKIYRSERDRAMRDSTHETLELVTGKHLPTNPPELEQAVGLVPAGAPSGVMPVNANNQPGALRQMTGWQH